MWIFICVFGLVLVAVIALQFPQTQKFLTGKAVAFLENKIKTRVELGEVNVAFPKSVVLKDIYIEDQKKDTLLYGHRIAVDIDMMGLLKSKVSVNNIELEQITGHVQRTLPDSAFNFDFIIEAFASDPAKEPQPEDTTGGMEVKVMGLDFQDIYITYLDEVTGMDANLNLGEFEVEMDEFDLNENTFIVDFIELHNTNASLVQTKLPTSTEDPKEEPLDLNFGLGELTFSSVNLRYGNKVNEQEIDLKLGELSVTADKIDLPNQKINLEEVALNNTSIVYVQNKTPHKDTLVHEKVAKKVDREMEQETQESGKPWILNLNQLSMTGNNLNFDDFNAPVQKEGMDFKHLSVQGLAMDIKNIAYQGLEVSADINQLIFREKSGFNLKNFTSELKLDSSSAVLAGLDIKTNKTHIQDHLEIGFESLETIADNIGDLQLNINLDNTAIAFEDILYFQPALSNTIPFKGNQGEVIYLNGIINGSVDNLSIPNFQLSALESTVFQANGEVKGLPDMDKAYIDMKISRFASTSGDIESLLPAGTLPETVRIPPSININADFKGYLKNFDANASVNTTFGNILAKVAMDPPKNGKEVYSASVDVNNLDLGKILKNDTVYGLVFLEARVNGTGLSMENMVANIEANVQKAVFQKYTYSGLKIDGKLIQKEFIGKINYSDSNLVIAFDGDLDFNKETPKYKFELAVKGADFKGLNLSEDDIRLKTTVVADIAGSDLNNLNGDLKINETLIIKNGRQYNVESFLFASINEKRRTDIKIESDLLDAKFAGTINLGDLATTLQQHFNQYFNLNNPEIKKFSEEQNFEFDIDIKNSDLLTDVLVPGLTKLRPGEISGKFNSNSNNLAISIQLPEVAYNNISINDFSFRTNSNQSIMNYRMQIESIMQDSTEIKNILLQGNVKDNTVATNLSISNDENREKFVVGGLLKNVEEALRVTFNEIVLNYNPWDINEDHYLQFGNGKFLANNIKFQNGPQFLILNTVKRHEPVGDLAIILNDFNLNFISSLFESKDMALTGDIDGRVILERFPGGGSFTSDLKINQFSFKGDTIGTISLLANNTVENKYQVDLSIKGEGNNVEVGGYYLAEKESNKLNFDVNIANLNLSTIEAYTAGQLTRVSGALKGRMKLAGSTDSPDINGRLNFQEAGFNVTYLNSYFLLDREAITFNNRGIHFNFFDIKDERNNTATINGSVLTTDFKEFTLNLDLATNDFMVLNTGAEDNDLFFGTVLVDSKMFVSGDINNPKIEAQVKLEEATNFTFVIPPDDPSKNTGEGVYEFVDYSRKVNPIIKQEPAEDTIQAQISGINLTAAISIDKDAQFNIVIDEERGDVLNLQGSTNEMVFAMDESGKITLSGRYVVDEGNYKLSFYNVVNKNFALKKGSTLVWNGEPLDAIVDISAIYTVETSSSNLMNGAQDAAYKQEIPFQVYLNMKGLLMNPDLSFDIKLPESIATQYEGVAGRLNLLNQNESEKNQQVFALIVLGGFIMDNSLSTGNEGGLEASIRGSVSEMLSQQLNKLSDKYIKGVDINVGLESQRDYVNNQGANTTNLNLGLSKQLFNDRVEVQVGSTINLEGNKQQRSAANFVGDMSVLYRLTDDGRYKLKAFRNNEYDLTQGEIIRTGVSFVFLREYNRLEELFRKSEDEEETQIIEENEEENE